MCTEHQGAAQNRVGIGNAVLAMGGSGGTVAPWVLMRARPKRDGRTGEQSVPGQGEYEQGPMTLQMVTSGASGRGGVNTRLPGAKGARQQWGWPQLITLQ